MHVFKTKKGHTSPVEIVGVGVLGPNGEGGAVLENAAASMSELQEKDEFGRLKFGEDGLPIPLTGAKLQAAGKEFAESRGLELVSYSDEKVQGLAAERGELPDFPAESLAEAGQSIYAQMHGTEPIEHDGGGNESRLARADRRGKGKGGPGRRGPGGRDQGGAAGGPGGRQAGREGG